MCTDRQRQSNRENAQLSTGPRTPEGLAICSRNNFRHGLAGAFALLDWESKEQFEELAQALRDEHAPQTPTETLLVEQMARHYWLAERALRLQHQCLASHTPEISDTRTLPVLMRYETGHQRNFHKCLDKLRKLRAERQNSEIGSESQKSESAAPAPSPTPEETRKQEMHDAKLRLLQAQIQRHESENRKIVGPRSKDMGKLVMVVSDDPPETLSPLCPTAA